MKKRTVLSRILSLVLALSVLLSMPVTAFAAEDPEQGAGRNAEISSENVNVTITIGDLTDVAEDPVDVETGEGETESVEVDVTVTESENADGSTTTRITAGAEDYETGNGAVVDYEASAEITTDDDEILSGEAHSEYTVISEDGTYAAEGGSDMVVELEAPEVTAEIPLTDGDDPTTEEKENETTVTDGTPEGTVLEVSGDLPEHEEDGEYDYTTVTVEEAGSVTVTTEGIAVTEQLAGESTDLDYVSSDTAPDATNDLVIENASAAREEYLPGYEGELVPIEDSQVGEEYDYIYVGSGNTSQLRPAVVFTTPLTYEEKVAMFGEERAQLPERTVVGPDGVTYYLHRVDPLGNNHYVEGWHMDGEWGAELNGEPMKDENGNYVLQQYVLLDENGEPLLDENGEVLMGDIGRIRKINGQTYLQFGVVYSTAQQFVLVERDTGEVITVYCADISTVTEDGFGYVMQNLEDADYYNEEQAEMIRSIALNGYWGTTGYQLDAEGNPVYRVDDAGNLLLDESGNPIPVPKTGSLEALREMMRQAVDADGNRVFTDEEIDGSLTDGVALTATQMAIWSYSNKMAGAEFINSHYVDSPEATDTNKVGVGALGNIPEGKEDEVKLMFKLYEYLRSLDPTSLAEEKTTANTVINKDNFLKDISITVLEKAVNHANNQDADSDNDAYVTNLTFSLVVTPSTENGDDLSLAVLDKDGNVVARGRIAGEAREGETLLIADENGNYAFQGITLVEGEQNFHITLEGVQNLEEGVYLYTSEVRTGEEGNQVTSQTMTGMANGLQGVNVSMNVQFELTVKDTVLARERVWREEWAVPPKTGDISWLYTILSTLSGIGLAGLQLLKRRKKDPAGEAAAMSREEVPGEDPPPDGDREECREADTAADAAPARTENTGKEDDRRASPESAAAGIPGERSGRLRLWPSFAAERKCRAKPVAAPKRPRAVMLC